VAAADAGIRLFSDASGTVLHVGTWNSLDTGLAGSDGPTQRLWYESDFYTTLTFALTEDFGVGATYTAYTSPNGSFSNVKEISFKVGPNDKAGYSDTFLHRMHSSRSSWTRIPDWVRPTAGGRAAHIWSSGSLRGGSTCRWMCIFQSGSD
jgi:hypothetical protein